MVFVAVTIQTPRCEDRLDIVVEINRLGGRTHRRSGADENQKEVLNSSHAAHEAAEAVHWRSLIETKKPRVLPSRWSGLSHRRRTRQACHNETRRCQPRGRTTPTADNPRAASIAPFLFLLYSWKSTSIPVNIYLIYIPRSRHPCKRSQESRGPQNSSRWMSDCGWSL